MKKIKSSGRLSLLLMLVFLGPIAAIAQTTPPADDPASAAAPNAGGDTPVSSDATPPTEAPAAEPLPAAEQAAPAAAKTEGAEYFESLPKPFFKRPFVMLFLFIIAVALVWVVIRRRKVK